jgi:DNA-binding transcriptional LysR family regulator
MRCSDVNRLRVIDAVARHGSVTAAAKELHYSQPSVSHHLARLEAESGAQLLQRVGRGIRLTPAGQLLADRAGGDHRAIDAAGASSPPTSGSAPDACGSRASHPPIGSLVPRAVAALTARHPELQITLLDMHPPEALELLRAGKIDVAIGFRYDETEPEPANVRLHHLLDDPVYLLSTGRRRKLAALRDATWIAGCELCRSHLLAVCADEGFEPRIAYTSDDMVVMQALVAEGLGVATLPGLALRAHRLEGINATELRGSPRHVYAATYGDPPDPPATAALVAALVEAAEAELTYGRPACGTSTVVLSSTASRAALRASSWKSGAAQATSVRPSSPPSWHAKTPSPSGIAISSTISPPGATRVTAPASALAAQMCPSASSVQPSGANVTAPSIVSMSARSGVGWTCAQIRRSVSAPSSAIVNAVKRAPNVSATISVPSSVMTVPLGNHRSSAAMLALPSGSIRHDRGRLRLAAAHEVEAEVAGVGAALAVDDHVVEVAGGELGDVGVLGDRAVGARRSTRRSFIETTEQVAVGQPPEP